MSTTEATLNRGTWYYAETDTGSYFGEIQNFEEDSDHPGLYWFMCMNHFDTRQNISINNRVRYSSRDFEQFSTLNLFSTEDGRMHLRHLTDRAASVSADADASQDAEQERSYIESNQFSTEDSLGSLPTQSTKKFSKSLGSGDMKTMLSVYEANPSLSFDIINKVIDETGHLLLTYTNNNVRQKIINQKINWLQNRHTMMIEPDSLYKLSYHNKDTIAIYLGDEFWAMHPTLNNSIRNTTGSKFIKIQKTDMINFRIQKLDLGQNREANTRIIQDVMSEIDPSRLDELSSSPNTEVYILSPEAKESIPKKEVSKNWQKAFVYNYYIGGTLDTKLDLNGFNDHDSIKKLAEIRNDTEVLEAMV